MKHIAFSLFAAAGLSLPASAFWPSDATTAFNSYNNAFYVGGANAYYKNDTTGGRTWFWGQAEEIEMALDRYAVDGSAGNRNMITALCNGFIQQNGTSWTWNTFNDDIAWAVIAFSRAYQITGNTNFRDRAKANFDAMYARAWSSDLGGGLWWTTDRGSKNTCVNCPSAIGAYLLYQIYGDSSYLTKSQGLYNWTKNTLFETNTGKVYDNISAGGVKQTATYSYNSGTFIGAANYLGFTSDATLAANYVRNNLCTGGILPHYGENGDGGGFNGIFFRWMSKFMKDRGLQGTYQGWLRHNANAAWNVRRTSDNLSWCTWRTPTPTTGTRYSFGCVNSVIALQSVAADGEGVMFCQDIDYAGVPSFLIGTGSYTLAQLQALNVSDDWATSLRVPPGWKVTMYQNDNFTGTSWTFTSDTSWIGSANDQMTSCKIETTGVIFYADVNYGAARSQTLAKGNYTLSQLQALGVSNDWASSLRVPPGWTVTVYEHDNFTGASWTFTSDTPWIGATPNDKMSSCRIQ
jgi:predicted alpha-1,6-mannanase (GH76 family)